MHLSCYYSTQLFTRRMGGDSAYVEQKLPTGFRLGDERRTAASRNHVRTSLTPEPRKNRLSDEPVPRCHLGLPPSRAGVPATRCIGGLHRSVSARCRPRPSRGLDRNAGVSRAEDRATIYLPHYPG